uniref:PKD2-3 n=1 Tax=Schmidtea mediterranea TaxID=79327 RepID=A0A0H3YJQ9_SCHMD|nr:PKD2-3 [Schmidtea mediterranea]
MSVTDTRNVLEAMECETLSSNAYEYNNKTVKTFSNDKINFDEKQNSKCSQMCEKITNYLWTTRTKIDGNKSNADIYIMTTLRELFIYLIFLVLLLLISFGTINANSFYFAAAMENAFINEGFDFGNLKDLQFPDLSNTRQYWEYLDNVALKFLFWDDSWVNSRPETSTEGNLMYFEIKLVGVARMRQVRSKVIPCQMPSYLLSRNFPCYEKYSIFNDDSAPMRPNKSNPGWTYTSSQVSQADNYYGSISLYGGGGYIIDLTSDSNKTNQIVSDLKEQTWIDRGTRAVFLDFVVFNINMNLFCKVRIVAEFPNFGGVVTSFTITPSKLLRYSSAFEYFILCCEILFVIFIIYYAIEVILEFREIKWQIFKNYWSIQDMVVVLVSIMCISFNIYRVIYVNQQISTVIVSDDTYPQFDQISKYDRLFQHFISINLFIAILKIFKYIRFNKTMTHLSSTLGRSGKEIFGFSVMFLIVFIAFAQLAYLMFGSNATDYSGMQTSVLSQFRIILGDFDYKALSEANGPFGAIYFVLYVFFVFFVLINMFVAIICENYVKVKHDETINNQTISMSEFFKSKTAAVMERFKMKTKKIVDIQDAINNGDLNNDSYLGFDEWRLTMKQKGYADCEIEAVFSKYDVDGDQVLDPYEQKQMHEQLEAEKKKISEAMNSEKDGSFKRQNSKSQINLRESDSNAIEYVTQEELLFLNIRMDGLENNVQLILQKIDQVLSSMESIELQKLNNQKVIGKILETFPLYGIST